MKQCFNPFELNNHESFLKLFLTFIKYVHSNFPQEIPQKPETENCVYNLDELKNQLKKFSHERNILKEAMSNTEDEMGKSAEEMWKEDMAKKKLAEENGDIEDSEGIRV